MLQFLGRGSAFADTQNCAFFEADGALILLDCPMSAFHRLRYMQKRFDRIAVLVTHTHSDHIGGIPMLIHFAKHVLHIPVTVIAPTQEVADDLRYLIERLDGCSPDAYAMLTADALRADWFVSAVPVKHAEALAGRCFGYVLRIGGRDVIYTGDTASLSPFLPYLHAGAYLYTEAAGFDSGVHLYIEDLLPEIRRLTAEGVHVYLMHLDDEAALAARIQGTGAEFAPLYTEKTGGNA
ncbi:MAG: ribonuclease Z [Oscillospiraceae bacterium]|nr:ribonuclease Z [Oscillospiraceae bacterium]